MRPTTGASSTTSIRSPKPKGRREKREHKETYTNVNRLHLHLLPRRRRPRLPRQLKALAARRLVAKDGEAVRQRVGRDDGRVRVAEVGGAALAAAGRGREPGRDGEGRVVDVAHLRGADHGGAVVGAARAGVAAGGLAAEGRLVDERRKTQGDGPVPCCVGFAGDGVGWDRQEREEEGESWGYHLVWSWLWSRLSKTMEWVWTGGCAHRGG